MDGWMDGSQLRAPSRSCCSGSHGISAATRILPCGSLLLVMAPGPHRKGRAARVAPSWAEHPATPSPRPPVCLRVSCEGGGEGVGRSESGLRNVLVASHPPRGFFIFITLHHRRATRLTPKNSVEFYPVWYQARSTLAS